MRAVKSIEFNPACEPENAHGYKNARWIENVSRGLRFVGFADEIARIDHRGWFTTDDNWTGETMRGVVYQLPSRQGSTLYVYGYADPCNPDCAFLCFDLESDKVEAARAADRFAEIFAEYEREYQRAWQAGRDVENIGERIQAARKQALAIAAEMRAAKKASVQAPTICESLRATVLSLYSEIQAARKERDELISDFGRQPGFTE